MKHSADPPWSEQESAVLVRDLTKQYGHGLTALNSVSFVVNPNDIYCLLGGPRSGKTTAIDCVIGLARPSAGSVIVLGENPVTARIRVSATVTYVNGPGGLYRSMSAIDNLLFLADLNQPKRRFTRISAANALRKVGVPERHLTEKLGRVPHHVGLAVSLALALLRETPILVLDEPTAGLDSRATADLLETLDDFRGRGMAILLTTADVLVAGQIADRIGVLKAGQLVSTRARKQLLAQNLVELYADYVGRPAPEAFAFARESSGL